MNVNTKESDFDYDLTRLQAFIDSFKQSDYWKRMETTVENSPWHREKNVAVHTEMALQEAVRWFPLRNDITVSLDGPTPGMPLDYKDYIACNFHKLDRRHIVLVSLAILFHDVGKPIMEVTKESEERGVYRSYANHEQASARAFEGYAIDHWDQFDKILSVWDVYIITWMIEHHLPFGLKDKTKIDALCGTLAELFLPNGPEVFYNALRGDTCGRTSDNYDVNVAKMEQWITDTDAVVQEVQIDSARLFDHNANNKRELVMMVGPAGAGKSTLREAYEETNWDVFSLDDLRVKYYFKNSDLAVSDHKANEAKHYRNAFHYCTENEEAFNKMAEEVLVTMFKGKKNILIDNTNTSAKSRRKYLTMARQRDMFCVACYIPTSLQLLLERNQTRGDKMLPPDAVTRQFSSVAVPAAGESSEFDVVMLFTHNYPER